MKSCILASKKVSQNVNKEAFPGSSWSWLEEESKEEVER